MNKGDKKRMARAVGFLEEAKAILEELRDAEQEKFDNMSEGLQASERGQAIETAANNLSSAYDDVETALASLEEIE